MATLYLRSSPPRKPTVSFAAAPSLAKDTIEQDWIDVDGPEVKENFPALAPQVIHCQIMQPSRRRELEAKGLGRGGGGRCI